ncbi:MAG: class I SAM-dependent methyltransferase [Smithella sp.]
MAFAAPMPQDSVLEEYNANYFACAHGDHPGNSRATAFFSGIARLRLAHLDSYLDKHNISVSRLLELGPGPGFFARNFLEKHPDTTYMAIETDTSCYASLQTIGVHVVAGSDLFENTVPVDVVVMSHVLEHVSKPIKFLTDATRNLRKGGALFIEVPCRDWEHKLIDEPHLLFFDKGPMHHLLSTLGFCNVQVSYHGQEIDRLRLASPWRSMLLGVRSKFLALGLVTPFAQVRPGMEMLTDPLERAVVAPFEAHCETQKPAWWLRALAIKTI